MFPSTLKRERSLPLSDRQARENPLLCTAFQHSRLLPTAVFYTTERKSQSFPIILALAIGRGLCFRQLSIRDICFNRNEKNPLECDVIIVDESSMIDTLSGRFAGSLTSSRMRQRSFFITAILKSCLLQRRYSTGSSLVTAVTGAANAALKVAQRLLKPAGGRALCRYKFAGVRMYCLNSLFKPYEKIREITKNYKGNSF